jgi:hypothetical protein
MENVLSKCCTGAKLHNEKDFKKWAHAVKALDELMRAERVEFEQISKTIRDANHRTNLLGEPSSRTNTMHAASSSTTNHNYNNNGSKNNAKSTYLPKMTPKKRQLLFDNEGCLKCHHPFVDHRSHNCPNDFPSGLNYRPLTQADVDRA